jgi:hypothetical protein
MTVLDEFGTVRYRVTVRGDGLELRGHLQATLADLNGFAGDMKPYGIVVASPLSTGDLTFFQEVAKEREAVMGLLATWDTQSSPGQDRIGWESDLEAAVKRLRAAVTR